MSILKVDTIQKADGTGSLSVPAESGTVVTTASPSLGRRNLIINGAMQVAQRGTSVSGGSMGSFQWVADRFWLYGPSTTSGSVSQSTDVPSNQGFIYSLYNNTDAACSIGTNVELPATGSAGLFYSGQTFTLSFWVKGTSPVTGQAIYCSFRDNAGGTNNVSLASGTSFDISTSWNRVQVPITIDNTPAGTNKAFQFEFSMPVGSKYTGFQLEVGSTATPFEHRSYGEELALCQRYYYKIGGETNRTGFATSAAHTTSAAYGIMHYPVTMRSAPSVSLSGTPASDYYLTGNSGNRFLTTFGTEGPNKYSCTLTPQASGLTIGAAYWFNAANASASIRFDAEL